MDFARRGELSKLQGLITEGKASLSDCDNHGETVYSVRTFLFVLLSYNGRMFKKRSLILPRLHFPPADLRWPNL